MFVLRACSGFQYVLGNAAGVRDQLQGRPTRLALLSHDTVVEENGR